MIVFEKIVRSIGNILSNISVVMLMLLMFLGAGDVIGRYIFNRPIIGTLETSQILMAGMILLTWADAQSQKAHLKVDILFSRYPPRVQAIGEFLTLLISLLLFSLIIWRSTTIALSDWQQGRIVETINLPLAPFKLFVPIGALVLCLEFIIQMVHLIPEMKRKSGE
jgi:TRAP-type C4-dicarboxylate transport system permease small subunit